jgi:hypothetical protein
MALPLLNELAANLRDTHAERDERLQIQAELERVSKLEQEIRRVRGEVRTLADSLQSLNGAFECYATAVKPKPSQASAK